MSTIKTCYLIQPKTEFEKTIPASFNIRHSLFSFSFFISCHLTLPRNVKMLKYWKQYVSMDTSFIDVILMPMQQNDVKRPIPETPALHQNEEHSFSTSSFIPVTSSSTDPLRPKSPPLGMTLSHFDASTGSYSSSVVNITDAVDTNVCSGMTPMYRTAAERFGSELL